VHPLGGKILGKKKVKARQKQQQSGISPVMIGVVVAAVIFLVGGLIILGNQSRVGAAVDESQFPSMGEANAPVVITEFSDFGCSHCRDFALETFDRLKADFVDTGKVKFVVHPFNFGRPDLALAVEAGWCAQDQNRYFDYKKAVFSRQGQMEYSQPNLINLAAETGLNEGEFSQCLSSREHQADVENARQVAMNRGIASTPTFFINQQRLEGNQPYEVFQKVIEQELVLNQ
jgi:protein-disulfide isomerase